MSILDMNSCIVRSHVISTKIWYNSSSMFGICGLILMQLSFSFQESNAILTDLSLFTVITAGDTKQSSSTSFIFSKCPDLISFSNSLPTFSCRCSGTGRAFCFTGKCPGFNCIFISVSFLSGCFQIGPEIFIILFFSDWLFSANCILPMVNLNVFIQSIPSNDIISVPSVIRISIFCLFFSYSMFTGTFSRNFTSFLFTSWYRFVTFWISACFVILSSGRTIVIGDPVSIIKSFFTPFILIVAV